VAEGARSEAGFALRTTIEPIVDVGRLDFVKVLVETRQDELIDEPDDEVPVQLEELDDEVPVQLEEPVAPEESTP
jgi:hypothetical protein